MAVFCGLYVLIAPPQAPLPHGSWREEGGELLGSAVVWLFVAIYGRTALKMLLRQGPVLERLLPEGTWGKASPQAKWLLSTLNKTHPFVGAATVLLVLGHALIEGVNQVNLLMLVVLVLALWQFGFGLFLLSHYQAVFVKKLKRYGYMIHAQLYTGIALGLCALFGHLLVTD
jgi:hypothetical protein